jgi:23S rRNA pseudouridine2605 synthase
MRLAKYLAHSGVASRRVSEEIIAAGRVRVAGEVVTDPARDVDVSSGVEVDGKPVSPEGREVWMLNKPVHVVSTAKEPGRRRSVVDLIPSQRRLYPVGRLDADSSGLILVANDGELANKLTHPRYEVPKTYRATLTKPANESQMRRLREGPRLDDGPTHPLSVRRGDDRDIEITIAEGRNRQVRRMVAAVGARVEALERIAFGSLKLSGLEPGESRPLTRSELRRLWKDAGTMDEGEEKGAGGRGRG